MKLHADCPVKGCDWFVIRHPNDQWHNGPHGRQWRWFRVVGYDCNEEGRHKHSWTWCMRCGWTGEHRILRYPAKLEEGA